MRRRALAWHAERERLRGKAQSRLVRAVETKRFVVIGARFSVKEPHADVVRLGQRWHDLWVDEAGGREQIRLAHAMGEGGLTSAVSMSCCIMARDVSRTKAFVYLGLALSLSDLSATLSVGRCRPLESTSHLMPMFHASITCVAASSVVRTRMADSRSVRSWGRGRDGARIMCGHSRGADIMRVRAHVSQ